MESYWQLLKGRHDVLGPLCAGAVYVSDLPGNHNFDILRRLVLPDGHILRASLPGRPTRDTLFCDVLRDSKSLLKVPYQLHIVVQYSHENHIVGPTWEPNQEQQVQY